jgi:hypothetical protein
MIVSYSDILYVEVFLVSPCNFLVVGEQKKDPSVSSVIQYVRFQTLRARLHSSLSAKSSFYLPEAVRHERDVSNAGW